MGLIDDFLNHFGRYIERRPTNPNVRHQVTSADSIGEHFDRDALRQQGESFYFHKGLAPLNPVGLKKFAGSDDFLKD
jgi:hypothetical protein